MKATKPLMIAVAALLSLPVLAQAATRTVANRTLYNAQALVQDRVAVNGTIRARADNVKLGGERGTESHLNADVWLSARLYQDWTAKMEIEPQLNLKTGKMNSDPKIPMNKLYVEGTVYNKMKLRAGKFNAFSSYGRVLDNDVTGADLSFNYANMPTKVLVGRVTKQFNDNPLGVGVRRKPIVAVQSKLAITPNTNVGATIAYVKDANVQAAKKNALFGEIGADTQLSPDLTAMAAYSVSNLSNVRTVDGKKVANQGAFVGVKYKNADWNVAGSYDAFANVRYVGAMSGVSSVEDYSKNVQGVQVGANFVPYKNVKLNAFYLVGKEVNAMAGGKKQKINVLRAQAEYKF